MALINCADCGHQISDLAPACPFCGRPRSVGTREPRVSAPPTRLSNIEDIGRVSWGKPVGIAAGLLMLILLARGCDESGDSSGEASLSATKVAPSTKSEASAAPVGPSAQAIKNWLELASTDAEATAYRLAAARNLIAQAPNSPEAAAAKLLEPKLLALQEEERSRGRWNYSSSEDPMSGKQTRTARVESENTLNFGFPYEGAQHGRLTLRKHPKWGNDVMVSIQEGQILCHSFSSCPISVRFDDSPAVTYTGTEPEDNSTEVAFIPGYSRFEAKLKTAKRVRIQFNVYQQGAVVLDFNVKGFDAGKMN